MAIEQTFMQPHSASRLLKNKLGKWINVPPGWPTYVCQETGAVFQSRLDHQWQRHDPIRRGYATRGGSQRYTTSFEVISLPPVGGLPTTKTDQRTFTITGSRELDTSLAKTPPEWWFEYVDGITYLKPLAEAIRHGTAICVTDGSFKDAYGTAAFILNRILSRYYTLRESIELLE